MKAPGLAIVIFGLAACLSSCMEEDCNCEGIGFTYLGNNFKAFVPQAFTPDGDGINDILKPVFSAKPIEDSYEMKISSATKTLFITGDPDYGWNGIADSTQMPEGDYKVYLRFTTFTGESEEKSFRILLMRRKGCGLPAIAAQYTFGDQLDGFQGPIYATQQTFCPF